MAEIRVLQTRVFERAYKRLHDNQREAVDNAIAAIVAQPALGEPKKGDLAGIHVYKFECVRQQFLLAYEFDPATRVLLLIGTHENFYRDLKRR